RNSSPLVCTGCGERRRRAQRHASFRPVPPSWNARRITGSGETMNAFKQKLRNRETASLVNADHASSGLVAFVSTLGIDAILLDCEQGNISFENIEDMTRAARLSGVSPIVRIPAVEPWTMELYVMRNIDGVVVPRLDTADQVAKAIVDIRYAAPRDFDEKAIIIQVESVSAVAELDDFLAIPEVDCFFIGAVDLAKSMGFSGDYR